MPINPRTQKLKGIIKEINSKTSQASTSTATSVSQHFKNRKSSCSSCSSHEATKDFSPASDDDHEYKPSSHDDSSSESQEKDKKKKERPQNIAKNYGSQPQSSLNNTNSLMTSQHISSSSESSTSSESSSSSSSSSSTSSDSSDVDSKQNSDIPSKRKCITLKQHSENVPHAVNKPKELTSLQQIASEYNMYSSSSEDDNILNENVDMPDLPKLTIHNSNNDNFEFRGREEHQTYHMDSISPQSFQDTIAEQNYQINQQENVTFNNPPSLKCIALERVNTIISQKNILSDDCPDYSNEQPRKRKRGNKKNIAKTLRNMGLQYTSSSKKHKVIAARKLGNPCNSTCRLKCSDNISEEQRKILFKKYWEIGSLEKQRCFIASHMSEVKPKYQYKKEFKNRKPKHAFYFTIDSQKKKVCKIFFKRTLGINDRPIRTVIEKLNTSGIVDPDLRGKHDNHGTKIKADLLEAVKRHINSIPRIESHYLRQQTSREYIEGGKTLTDLYRDYKKECQENGLDYVKINIYRQVFKDFNISFFIPKKDRCEDCVAYENALPEDKEKLEEFYRSHLKEKEFSREEKLRDKELINDKNIVACYDLQAMLQVPKGDVSSFYYKSRLNCMNFTICELKTDYTECYFWTEVEGHKGANEIGSCVFKFLEKKSETASGNINITFYSDNAFSQNKNQFVFSMYIYAVKNLPNINSITHKFLVKGHTQNEGDSVHSTIERQVKKMLRSGPIYVPDQYINAIREAKKKGNKYNVIEMSHSEFYNIKKLQEYKLTKNIEAQVIKISDIRIIKIDRADSSDVVRVFYKSSYMEQNFKEIKLLKIPRVRPQLLPLFTSKLPLADNKKKDLKDLIKKNAILPYYVSSYYNHIL